MTFLFKQFVSLLYCLIVINRHCEYIEKGRGMFYYNRKENAFHRFVSQIHVFSAIQMASRILCRIHNTKHGLNSIMLRSGNLTQAAPLSAWQFYYMIEVVHNWFNTHHAVIHSVMNLTRCRHDCNPISPALTFVVTQYFSLHFHLKAVECTLIKSWSEGGRLYQVLV